MKPRQLVFQNYVGEIIRYAYFTLGEKGASGSVCKDLKYCRSDLYDLAILDFNKVIELIPGSEISKAQSYHLRGVSKSRQNLPGANLDIQKAKELGWPP